jgi:hypothetical protein
VTLQQVYGSDGAAKVQAIQQAGQIVFHSVGDTGSVVGPATQSLVADKMVTDFNEANAADVPSFFLHMGDIVYYFGEATYYYDQFFESYRVYPAPILAIAAITTASCIPRISYRRSMPFCATSARQPRRNLPTPAACCVQR